MPSCATAGGRLYGFLFGWAQLVIIRAASLGAISITFAEYFIRVLGYDPRVAPYDMYSHRLAAVAIVVTATFNIVGVKWGALVTNLTTLAKYGGLMFIIILALTLGLPETGGHFTPAVPPGSFSIAPFGLALVAVLWAYDGWADLTFAAGEIKDPQRNLPRALIGGTLAVIADLCAGEHRVPVGARRERDPELQAGGGRRGGAADRAEGRDLRVGDGDALDVRDAEQRAADLAAHPVRDGRRQALLQAGGEGAPEVRDAVRGGACWSRRWASRSCCCRPSRS